MLATRPHPVDNLQSHYKPKHWAANSIHSIHSTHSIPVTLKVRSTHASNRTVLPTQSNVRPPTGGLPASRSADVTE